MPTAESFWDRHALKYSQSPIKNMDAYEATLRRVRAHLNPTDRVLEIGCGTGTTALKLAEAAGSILGTDISSKMVDIAQEKGWDAGVKTVTFRQAQADALLDDDRFDVVMAFNLIHLLPDYQDAIRRMADNLTPGGLLITKTPCVGDWSIALRFLLRALHGIGYAPQIAVFTPDQLDQSITNAGLTILETGFYPEKARSRLIVARKPDA